MGIFKPNVEKMATKKDIEGLVKALERKDVRERAVDSIRTLIRDKQIGHFYVQLLLHWGLFNPNEDIRKSIAQCLSSVDVAVRQYVVDHLEETERRGWAALMERGLQRPPMDMRTETIPRIPDEAKLAVRVAQFKTWMNLASPRKHEAQVSLKQSNAKSKTRAAVSKEVAIRCEGCGKIYTLGKDAIVVSVSAVRNGFVGVTIIGDGFKNTKDTPDLVDSLGQRSWSSLDQATVRQQQAEIRRISSSLSSGNPQWWKCRSCGHVQIYQKWRR